jgi:hypothetical protein
MNTVELWRRWLSVSSRRRLWFELAVLVGLLVFALPIFRFTVGWDIFAFIKRTYRVAHAYVYFPLQARSDPALGRVLTLPSQDQIVSGQIDPTAFKAIIFFDYPSPCAMKFLTIYQIVQKANPSLQIVLVFSASKTMVQQTAKVFSDKRFVWVADEKRIYATQLNAYYVPRVYLIDSQVHLRYVQHYRTPSYKALMEAVELLSSKEAQQWGVRQAGH